MRLLLLLFPPPSPSPTPAQVPAVAPSLHCPSSRCPASLDGEYPEGRRFVRNSCASPAASTRPCTWQVLHTRLVETIVHSRVVEAEPVCPRMELDAAAMEEALWRWSPASLNGSPGFSVHSRRRWGGRHIRLIKLIRHEKTQKINKIN